MNTTPQLLDWNLIRQMAAVSARAYSAATVNDVATDTQALVTVDGDKIIVAFRGSSSIRDFVQDVKARMTELMWSSYDTAAEVHAGFLQSFEAVDEEVVRQVRVAMFSVTNPKIYITGHSLGGALAMLCALEFARQKFPIAGVITFGAPRVGNKTFAVIYNNAWGQPPAPLLKDITLNVVNEGDPVPLLPTLLMGYRDCGTELFVKRSGEVLTDPFIGFQLIVDLLGAIAAWRNYQLGLLPNHFIHTYQERIQNL